MRINRFRPAAVAVSAAACLVLLAGCGPSLPEVTKPSAATGPDVVDAQLSRIYSSTSEDFAAADAALATTDLTARADARAIQVRGSQYKIARSLRNSLLVRPISFTPQSQIITTDADFPRFFMTVSVPEADSAANENLYPLMVYRQDAARSGYKVWGWTYLLPNAEMPQVALPNKGAEALPPDAEGLLVTPAQAAAQYADIRAKGSKSQYISSFADDAFRTQIAAQTAKLRTEITKVGSFSVQISAETDPIFAVRTQSGGALVVASIKELDRVKVTVEDGSVALPAEFVALAGKSQAESAASISYLDTMAFYIPPAGSDEKIQVLAGDHQLVAVSAT